MIGIVYHIVISQFITKLPYFSLVSICMNIKNFFISEPSWCDGGRRHICSSLRHSSLTDDYGNFVVQRLDDCDCPVIEDPEPPPPQPPQPSFTQMPFWPSEIL